MIFINARMFIVTQVQVCVDQHFSEKSSNENRGAKGSQLNDCKSRYSTHTHIVFKSISIETFLDSIHDCSFLFSIITWPTNLYNSIYYL